MINEIRSENGKSSINWNDDISKEGILKNAYLLFLVEQYTK